MKCRWRAPQSPRQTAGAFLAQRRARSLPGRAERRRGLLLLLLLFAAAGLVFFQRTEIETLTRMLTRADGRWLAGAALVQIGCYLFYAGSYRAAFGAVGVAFRLRDLFPLALVALAAGAALGPVAPAAQSALYVDDAARRGNAPARASAGWLLAQAADLCAIALLVAPAGVVSLLLHGALGPCRAAGALLLALGQSAFLVILLVAAFRRPQSVRALLETLQRAATRAAARVGRPLLLPESWAERAANDWAEAVAAAGSRARVRLPLALALAAAAHAGNVALLWLLSRAFGTPIDVERLAAGYAAGVVSGLVAPTPQGIGVIEGAITWALVSLGVPVQSAAPVVLVYRGLTLWLPLLLGVLLARRVATRILSSSTPLRTGHA